MTKKDLLENEYFKKMPDETPIVFHTDKKLWKCQQVKEEQIYCQREIDYELDPYFDKRVRNGDPIPLGLGFQAIVIDAIPAEVVKEKLKKAFDL